MNKKIIIVIVSVIIIFVGYLIIHPRNITVQTQRLLRVTEQNMQNENPGIATTTPETPYVTVPSEVKAIYVTGPVASSKDWINKLINLANTTEINAMVVNIKDGSGTYLNQTMANLAVKLRENNIYPIARIVVFQDNELAKNNPAVALRDKNGKIWAEKSYNWVDPSSKEVWNYNLDIANKALNMGFEEINFDYFRFPSGGQLNEIVFPNYDGSTPKEKIIDSCAEFLVSNIKKDHPNALVSLDIFGYTFLKSDLGIGQNLINLSDYFDVIAPMVYPSHYAPGNFGFKNPAQEPYQVVLQTLLKGEQMLSVKEKKPIIRPWIQDFDLGAVYDVGMFRKQIDAIKDAGLSSGWMVWNPKNIYDVNKFLPKK